MLSFPLLITVLTTCAVIIGAACDLKRRLIPNAVTITAISAGIVAHTAHSGWKGLSLSLGGIAVGGGALLLFHLLGAMGAGDVKLMGGVGALLGYRLVLSVLIFTVIAGGLMAAGKLILRRVGRYEPERTVDPDMIPVRPAGKGMDSGRRGGGSAMRETIPYGVAIAAGTLMTLILAVVGGGISH